MAYTTIDKPTDYFNTVTYTGDGNSSRSITGVGFQPNWVWTKKRNGATGHRLVDSVRGVTKALFTNGTNVESTESNGLTAFASDGYTLGDNGNYNANSDTYVSWNWLAGSSAGSSNSDGSITSTVSANQTAGFSIVSWSADGGNTSTAGHSLGITPQIIIYKSRGSGAWYVWLNQIIDSSNDYLLLNSTNAKGDIDTSTYGTPSSTTISNFGFTSGENMIAYCFTEKKGYSKFGSYTGNGSTDGTFVYTGFKPAWVMFKCTSHADPWNIVDNTRSPFNVADKYLDADSSAAEGTYTFLDFTANGIKLKNTGQSFNGSGRSYIYMAFAESPFVNSNSVPNNAR